MTTTKLRIAFVDYIVDPDKPGRSGLSDVVWDMASELIHQGHEAHVIASYRTDDYPDSRVKVHRFPTPPMGYRNVVGHIWMLKRAADIAKRLQPDVIHAPEYLSTAVFASLGVAYPLVLTVPGNVFHRIRYGHSYEWYYLQILKWAARVSARRCACVIAVSQEMKTWWEWTGSAPERTRWIPYGIDPQRFHPASAARERLGIPDDRLFLLYVGRFSQEKGLLDLLHALAAIKQHTCLDQVLITLVGKGPQSSEIEQMIEAEQLDGTVQIRRWVDQAELSTWYSAADALLVPSHSEAFARVIPEAMSCGTPVIGSKITGTEDHVRDELNGFLFPAGDVEALSEILLRVVYDPAILRGMRPSTLQYVQDNLTWRRIVERIIRDVYLPITATRANSKLALGGSIP